MKRSRTSLVLLCSVLVIVLGALLPWLVSRVADSLVQDKVSYAQVDAVHLEFEEESMTLREKLALLGNLTQTVPISENLSRLSAADVRALTAGVIEQYVQAGLLPASLDAYDSANTELIPEIVLNTNARTQETRSNLFWSVQVYSPDNGILSLLLDDETGVVCTINFDITNSAYFSGDFEARLSAFRDLYLDGLNGEFTAFGPIQGAGPIDKWAGSDISWTDPVYGEVRINLLVYEFGFYAYIY